MMITHTNEISHIWMIYKNKEKTKEERSPITIKLFFSSYFD
jgi:hypothetical protein